MDNPPSENICGQHTPLAAAPGRHGVKTQNLDAAEAAAAVVGKRADLELVLAAILADGQLLLDEFLGLDSRTGRLPR